MNLKISIVALGAALSIVLTGSTAYAAEDASSAKTKPKVTVVTVKAGDTLSAIAKKYNTTYVKLFNANKSIINPDLIDIGDKIRIPKKSEKLPDRFSEYTTTSAAYAQTTNYAPVASTSYTPATAPVYNGSSAGNTYAWGNCTWYVKNRRPSLPNMLGNGGQWAANAAAMGYATGSTPRVGAVAEQPGHVAYVESVHGNGTITISEMNYAGGIGQVHTRTVNSSDFYYIY